MAVLIGHASIDEKGKGMGGTAGDQTGKEVCTRNWLDYSWDFVLRPKDATVAAKMVKNCKAGCANNKIGYDMGQRNTLYAQAVKVDFDLSKIITACECDCSSFMTVCAIGAGVKLTYGTNAPVTANMKAKFSATGQFDVLTDSKYLKQDSYLKAGDILVRDGHHTAMVLTNGSAIVTNTTDTQNTTTTTKSYYTKYIGTSNSLVDALKTVGVTNTSLTARTAIAKLNGITNYSGTASQNTILLNLLKQGKLVKSVISVPTTNYYAKYTGTSVSIVTALNSLGVNSTYAHRALIAKANRINSYTGTATQNTQMLNLLKQGKLIKA